MSMELDKTIGRYFYGWSEEMTEINKWYDPWAMLWRPIPSHEETPTPAFSTSLRDAMKLVCCLAESKIFTVIICQGDFTVNMHGLINTVSETGAVLPDTIARCAIKFMKENGNEDLHQWNAFFKAEAKLPQAG